MNNEIIEQPSWWKRNWKWALPTGGCLTIILVVVAFIGYAAYKVSDAFSNGTSIFAFAKVIKTVQEHPQVIETLGKPIDVETDNYDPTIKNDMLDIEMVLDGSKSDGVLRVKAQKMNEEWVYEVFTVTLDETKEVIDLRDQITDEF